jgi:hypothetical protein
MAAHALLKKIKTAKVDKVVLWVKAAGLAARTNECT